MTTEQRLELLEERIRYLENQLGLLTDFLAEREDVVIEEVTVN